MAENGCEEKRDKMELREKQESDPGRVSKTWFNLAQHQLYTCFVLFFRYETGETSTISTHMKRVVEFPHRFGKKRIIVSN